jgi:hypothetical protein
MMEGRNYETEENRVTALSWICRNIPTSHVLIPAPVDKPMKPCTYPGTCTVIPED